MALTPSKPIDLGSLAPDFSLNDFDGRLHTLRESPATPATLVMFICNHCPFVVHLKPKIAEFCQTYQKRGLKVFAIMPNDIEKYPEDSPLKMKEDSLRFSYNFPYLLDESQKVARAYDAACTPEFYLYDAGLRLYYHGQFDESRPTNQKPVTGADLAEALENLLGGRPHTNMQYPSTGCNIKWRT